MNELKLNADSFTEEQLRTFVERFQKADVDPSGAWYVTPVAGLNRSHIVHVTVGSDDHAPSYTELEQVVNIFRDVQKEGEGVICTSYENVKVDFPIKVDVLEFEPGTEFVGHSALPSDLKAGRTWTHTKTGNGYEVITVSNLNSTKSDFVPTVVYRDEDGAVWSRPVSEFLEKFEPVRMDAEE